MDDVWIKNLANAQVDQGQIIPQLACDYDVFIESRIRDSMQQVYDLAHAYAASFNTYATDNKHINCLPIPADAKSGEGVLLLLGNRQIKLAPSRGYFIAEGTAVESFVRNAKFKWMFKPHTDACGSVVWSQDNQLLMGPELLIKKLFEHIVQWHADAESVKHRITQSSKESFHES